MSDPRVPRRDDDEPTPTNVPGSPSEPTPVPDGQPQPVTPTQPVRPPDQPETA